MDTRSSGGKCIKKLENKLALLKAASDEYQWNLNYGDIVLLWRGGCIIRAQFLDRIKEAFSANMIQAQRDYFGAHTYERVDKLGVFHSQWLADGVAKD